LRREQVRREYEAGKQGVVNHMHNMDLENDRAVEEVLSSKGKQQQEMISGLLENEKYQRDAFSALFMKQDSKNKEISLQVEQIQKELASLSMVEMTKKEHKIEMENDVMRGKRETLSAMLVELINQKQQRQQELAKRLEEMDQTRNQEQDNYWLIQYQKLMDSKPKGLVEAESKIDPALKDLLTRAGAEDYIPVFATRNLALKQVSYMNDRELMELGMHNLYLRQKVMMCVKEYAEMQERLDAKLGGGGGATDECAKYAAVPTAPVAEDQPSAPPMQPGYDDAAASASAPPPPLEPGDVAGGVARAAATASALPSAPPAPIETFKSTECCVCMERKCDIIFLPCGHVCCCWICEGGLSECPLCRGPITQKVRLA